MYDKIEQRSLDYLHTVPWRKDYHDRLEKYLAEEFPGTVVVAMPDRSSLIEELFTQAVDVPKEGDVIFLEGRMGRCHDNCLSLLAKKEIDTWMIGYALSDDARWRHHSWGLKDGKIVETTIPRIAYLGKVEAKRNAR